jgi:hypothetical protein
MPRARATSQEGWPPRGPHLQLLRQLDDLREALPTRPSFRTTATAMGASHEAVRSWLTGAVLPTAQELGGLVTALGGGPDDRDKAVGLHEQVREAKIDSPRSERAPTPPPDRLLARDRAALQPSVLRPMPRIAAVARTLDAAAEPGTVSVLVGDGGLGKSVLIGQLLDRVGTTNGDVGWFPPSAVLVSAAAVAGGAALADPESLDCELGRASGVDGGLLDRVRRAAATFGSCSLILDALDVILDDETVPALAGLLAAAAEVGDVLVSCRKHEFGAYFTDLPSSAPALVDRVRQVPVPELTAGEIVRWAEAHLTASGPLDTEARGFLASLTDGVDRAGPLRTVCSVPVRLALTCQVFAEQGRVPVDLTVTELYQAYRATRIARHRGRGGPQARAKDAAALAVAKQVVGPDERLTLRIPKGQVAEVHERNLSLLVSEGVLRDLGTAWEFFHQSFAEFMHAQVVLSGPADSPQRQRLRAGVADGRRNLWQIVGSMFLQADEDTYLSLTDSFPVDDPVGARWHVLGALRRKDDRLLVRALERTAPLVDAMDAVLPVLADVPVEHIDTALDATAGALRRFPDGLSGPATATAATLLARLPHEQHAAHLATILDAAFAVVDELKADVWDARVATLIEPFRRSGLSGEAMGIVHGHYKQMGSRARQASVRAATSNGNPADDDALAALGELVLREPSPSLSETEAAGVIQRLLACAPLRARRGWHDWEGVLFDQLGDRWDHAQFRVIADRAEADPDVLLVLVDALATTVRTNSGRLISVFKRLLPTRATELARRLVRMPQPPSPLAVGVIAGNAATLATLLDHADRAELAHWLEAARTTHPRRVWPAVLALASSDAARLRELLADLLAAEQPPAVLTSALDATVFNASPEALLDTIALLDPLLTEPDRREQRARWAGRLTALADDDARRWVTDQVLTGPSPNIAGTAVKSFVDGLRATARPADTALTHWLATLLPSVHANAVKQVATTLADPRLTDDDAVAAAVDPVTVFERYRRSIERGDDGQVVAGLVELLNRLDTFTPLPPETVEAIYEINRGRLPAEISDLHGKEPTADQSAALRVISRLAGTLLARRLPVEEVWRRLAGLLTPLDPARVGANISDLLGSMLIGFCSRGPQTLDWLETLYRTDGVSAEVQLAIAKAVVFHDGREAGGRAARLKDDRRSAGKVISYLAGVLGDRPAVGGRGSPP